MQLSKRAPTQRVGTHKESGHAHSERAYTQRERAYIHTLGTDTHTCYPARWKPPAVNDSFVSVFGAGICLNELGGKWQEAT